MQLECVQSISIKLNLPSLNLISCASDGERVCFVWLFQRRLTAFPRERMWETDQNTESGWRCMRDLCACPTFSNLDFKVCPRTIWGWSFGERPKKVLLHIFWRPNLRSSRCWLLKSTRLYVAQRTINSPFKPMACSQQNSSVQHCVFLFLWCCECHNFLLSFIPTLYIGAWFANLWGREHWRLRLLEEAAL